MSFLQSMFGGAPVRITGAKARELVAAGAQLVDVRTPGEFAAGHVEGAKNIPVGEIAGRMNELDKATPVVLYCRSGARSSSARNILMQSGFDEVHDFGPMTAW